MTEEDLKQLNSAGVRFAYDLRSRSERRTQVSKLPELSGIQYDWFDHDQTTGDLQRALRLPESSPEGMRQLMMSTYESLPYDLRHAYRSLFLHLADGDVPIVVNCTAGKDRTGVAAALVLSVLGVQRDAVFDDYLLTRQFFDRTCAIVLQGKYVALFDGVDRKVWEPLMKTDTAYLHAMFDRLNREHGSVIGYVESELGISPALIERIQMNLLE
jgi:protein-tyrosine phosphatase